MVDDWFLDFVTEHRARHPHAFLPALEQPEGEKFYEGWRSDLIHKGIHDYAIATEASTRLMAEMLKSPRDHFPRLCEIAVSLYKQRNITSNSGDASSVEAVIAASKDCPHCEGRGWARIEHDDPAHVPPTTVAYCVCLFGRWIRNQHAKKAPDLVRRIPDFDLVRAGRLPWHLEQPSVEDLPDPVGVIQRVRAGMARIGSHSRTHQEKIA